MHAAIVRRLRSFGSIRRHVDGLPDGRVHGPVFVDEFDRVVTIDGIGFRSREFGTNRLDLLVGYRKRRVQRLLTGLLNRISDSLSQTT